MTEPRPPREADADALAMEELAEAVADLRAQLQQATSRLSGQGRTIAELAEQYAVLEESADATLRPLHDGDQAGHSGGDGTDHTAAPTFILYLPDETDEDGTNPWQDELTVLATWVEGIVVPFYLGEADPGRPWCPRWFDHPEAIARLHACWMAWQELTDPQAGGHTGPSTWHRDHLYDAMTRLTAPDGPFAGCSADPAHPAHWLPGTIAIVSYPPDGLDPADR